MGKIALIAAALTVAGAAGASAQNWRAQDSGWRDQGGGHAPYGYGNSTSALGRFCPPGYYPHSWPSQSGIRCEPPGGSTTFIAPH